MPRPLLALSALLLLPLTSHAQNLVSCDMGGGLWRVNTTTGAATNFAQVGAVGNGMIGLTLGPGGDYYYLRTFNQNDSGLYRINHTTNVATRLFDVFGSFAEGDLRYNAATGTMYAAGELFSSGFLCRISLTTGDVTPLGTTTGMGDPTGIAFNAAGDMYVYDTASSGIQNNPALKRINPANGQVLSTVSLTIGGNPASLLGSVGAIEFDPNGNLYLTDSPIAGNGRVYTVNTATGALTPLGLTGFTSGFSGLVYDPVPTPTTAAALALLALPIARRRRTSR